MKQTNFARLQDARLIDSNYKFTDDDRRVIESLSPEEVDTIISVARKLLPNRSTTDERLSDSIRGIIL